MSRRNEEARARRRQQLKKEESLTSVKTGNIVVASGESPRRPDLSNHFGWRVLREARVRDSSYPHISEYWEHGEVDRVTYVMYLQDEAEGKEEPVRDADTTVKATQTESQPSFGVESHQKFSVVLVPSATSLGEIERQRTMIVPRKRVRKLITEFYYVPREDRLKLSNPVPSGDTNEPIYEQGEVAQEVEAEVEGATKRVEKKVEVTKRRGKKEGWGFRAGAERMVDQKQAEVTSGVEAEVEDAKNRVEDMSKKVEAEERRGKEEWNLRAGAERVSVSQYGFLFTYPNPGDLRPSGLEHRQKHRVEHTHSVSSTSSSCSGKSNGLKRNRKAETRKDFPVRKTMPQSKNNLKRT
uniref:Uncharacterized protein n=1 Tax=Graphocephala atropunctata TaxID=36148 RepID=A0A1B6L6Z7_9HEMI